MELVRYIHLNPKRAHLEERVGEYPWTSHAQYLGKEKKPLVRVSKEALGMFRSKAPEKAYNKFVLAGIGEGHRRDLYETSGWQILGPDGYAARMLSKISERPERPFKLNMGFVEIWAKIKGRERLGGEPIGRSRRRLISEAVWVAVNGRGETQTKIACYLDMTQSGISRALNGLEERFKKDPNERRRLVSWARSLKKS